MRVEIGFTVLCTAARRAKKKALNELRASNIGMKYISKVLGVLVVFDVSILKASVMVAIIAPDAMATTNRSVA